MINFKTLDQSVWLCWYFGSSTPNYFPIPGGMLRQRRGFNEKFVYLFRAIVMGCCRAARVLAALSSVRPSLDLADWIMTMENAFPGCLADIALMCSLHGAHACQGLNGSRAFASRCSVAKCLCARWSNSLRVRVCAYLFGYLSSSKWVVPLITHSRCSF